MILKTITNIILYPIGALASSHANSSFSSHKRLHGFRGRVIDVDGNIRLFCNACKKWHSPLLWCHVDDYGDFDNMGFKKEKDDTKNR